MTKPPRVLNLNFIATAMLVLAAIFITYQFAALPQEIKGLAGIVLSAVFFALAYLVLTLEAHKAELAKLNADAAIQTSMARMAAAKAGTQLYAQLAASSCGPVTVTGGSDNRTVDAAGAHRMNLELAAMNALAHQSLIDLSDAKAMGARIRAAIDALLDKGAATGARCTCGPNQACSNCPRNVPATKATAGAVLAGSGHATADDSVEAMIQAKGKTAARVTPADIAANIASEHYFVASDALQIESTVHHVTKDLGGWMLGGTQLLTFCVLQLRNGFIVTGESACASPENFDAEIGRKIARENAINKIWPLMGYELRSQLARRVLTDGDAAADLAGTPRPDNHVD